MPELTSSLARLKAMLIKEFIQMRRDRLTFAMMVAVPMMQLLLFGYAINMDPKGLPTAVVDPLPSIYSRSVTQALSQSGYFRVVQTARTADEVDHLLGEGAVQFVITFPSDLLRRIERGEAPDILVEADATDPAATGNALGSLQQLTRTALAHDLPPARAGLPGPTPPINFTVHRRYNPEGVSSRHIVPGLIGIVLTMTMVIMTSLAVTSERERGTMETLLAMPLRPYEVMIGKIVPYVMVGYIQVT